MIHFAHAIRPSSPARRDATDVNDRLGDEIAALAAHLHSATYRLLTLLREYDAREAWGWGFRSCAHWLSWRTGIALGPAREKVRVARALGSLPLISAAMERGELSYSKVRALTRVATADNEQNLLEFAQRGTASHVERLVRAWRKVDPEEEAAGERLRHDRRYVSLYPSEDGSWELRGRLDPEVGALLEKSLEWAREQLYGRRPSPETSAGQRRADALGLVAEQALTERPAVAGRVPADAAAADRSILTKTPAADRSVRAKAHATAGGAPKLAHAVAADVREKGPGPAGSVPAGMTGRLPVDGGATAPTPVDDSAVEAGAATPTDTCDEGVTPTAQPRRPVPKRADRFQVVLHVERPARGGAPDGRPVHGPAVLASTGQSVPAETWRRLACDASLVEMAHDADGNALHVGRKRRTIPPAIRRALEHRDRECRFPGCECRYCDAHHVEHWAEGGETRVDNLIRLCRVHHRAVHEGGFRVEIDGDGAVRFRTPGGWLVPEVPPLPAMCADGAVAIRGPTPWCRPSARTHADERAGLAIDPWMPMPSWHAGPLDLDWAIFVIRDR